MTETSRLVTLIAGDGIGPEVATAARRIVDATGAPIEWELHEAGAEVFKKGLPTGVPQDTIDSIARSRVVLKGPLETPVGFGEKSANVTLRKLFETYANIRPARELPGVVTPYSGRGIDLVVVRENIEDLYAGIEHMQTPGVAQCLKLISRKGCEKIVRLAFEFARAEGRTSVACATKANIMKLTEGLMKRTFEEIAPEYPDIESWHVIVDNCAHQLVKRPEQYDVIVTTNMNGDILSDLTSGLIGGLGFASSANIGSEAAIFEAVHGSAPKYAGKDVINPTAMIGAAVMMLRHLELFDEAARIENGLLATLEDGIVTRDVAGDEGSVGTVAFTDAIIERLDRQSPSYHAREFRPIKLPQVSSAAALVTASSRRDGRRRRVRRVGRRRPGSRAAHRVDRRRNAAAAEDHRQPRHARVPADRHADRLRRRVALPVLHPRRRRSGRRRPARAARPPDRAGGVHPRREAARVRRRGRVHEGAGRGLA